MAVSKIRSETLQFFFSQREGEEGIDIQIDDEIFGHWTECEVTLAIDTFDTVTFKAPWDPSMREIRDAFRPFKYQKLEVSTHLDTLFQGYLVNVDPKVDAQSKTITANGYAKPGVLCDCDMPARVFDAAGGKVTKQLEFKQQHLQAIAKQCCDPFGIPVEFLADEGKAFPKVKIGPDQKVFDFLKDLAKQRNLVITNALDGTVLFWQSVDPGQPRARFVEGKQPFKTIEPQFNPREYFSEITGYAAKKRRSAAAKWTETNPWLSSPLRPSTFKLEDTEPGDAKEATQARIGRMFANCVSWTIPDIPGWRDPNDRVWEPNTTVTVHAPGAMIYQETELLIKTVKLKRAPDGWTSSLELALPGAFNGKAPETLPWDEAVLL